MPGRSPRHLPLEVLEQHLKQDTGSCYEGRRVYVDLIRHSVPDPKWRPADYPRLGQLA